MKAWSAALKPELGVEETGAGESSSAANPAASVPPQ